jgi:hypothetical protein
MLALVVGFIIGAFTVANAYDSKDATRVRLGYMTTSQGVYKLTEVGP